MSFLSLIVKVGADASGFNAGLKEVERTADSFAGRFGAKFTKTFATGLAVTGFISIARSAMEAARNIDETRKSLEDLGVTMDDTLAQSLKSNVTEMDSVLARFKLLAIAAGSYFGSFTSGALKSASYMISYIKDFVRVAMGGSLDSSWIEADIQDDAERMAKILSRGADESQAGRDKFIAEREARRLKIAEQIKEMQDEAYLKSLSAEEKLVELTMRRKMLSDIINGGRLVNTDKLLQANLELATLDRDIAGVKLPKQPKPKQGSTITLGGVNVDDLSKIGVFNQASDSMVQSYADKILRVAEAIEENTAEAVSPVI